MLSIENRKRAIQSPDRQSVHPKRGGEKTGKGGRYGKKGEGLGVGEGRGSEKKGENRRKGENGRGADGGGGEGKREKGAKRTQKGRFGHRGSA